MAIALAGFFIFLTGRLTQTEMTVLFSELDGSDSGKIVTKLEALKIPFKIAPDGTRILVPLDLAPRLRMTMAEEGIPSGGSIGYELIDKTSALGTTSFVQRINQVRALEGELARSIRSLGPVRAARVHLVMPRREVFARDTQDPTASIVLSLKPGVALARSQVSAIQNLVASAVPKLAPGRVSVVDDKGNLLARGEDEDKNGKMSAATADDLRLQYETRRARTIEQMLERAVGVGKVRVEVTADMDFDRVETRSEEFDPNSVVARSVQETTRENKSNEADPTKSVSVQNNLPDRNAQTPQGGQRQSSSTETERTENNEVSKKITTHLREAGLLKRMTVSVLVDGTYQPSKDAAPTYQARRDEELEKIATLVRGAIGYDEKRGDKVDVVNMQFVRIGDEIGEEEPAGGFLGLTKPDFYKIAELAVLGILALLALLLVFRPALNRILAVAAPAVDPAMAALPAGQVQAALTGPAGTALVPGLAGAGVVGPDGTVMPIEDGETEENLIDISRVEGRVKASSLKRIGELVEKHPEEAVGILRHWMYQQS